MTSLSPVLMTAGATGIGLVPMLVLPVIYAMVEGGAQEAWPHEDKGEG